MYSSFAYWTMAIRALRNSLRCIDPFGDRFHFSTACRVGLLSVVGMIEVVVLGSGFHRIKTACRLRGVHCYRGPHFRTQCFTTNHVHAFHNQSRDATRLLRIVKIRAFNRVMGRASCFSKCHGQIVDVLRRGGVPLDCVGITGACTVYRCVSIGIAWGGGCVARTNLGARSSDTACSIHQGGTWSCRTRSEGKRRGP